MKHVLLILIGQVMAMAAIAQQSAMSCCAASATEVYATNASNKSFRGAHELPPPYVHKSENGKDITYKTPDGKDAHAWELKSKTNSPYYLFVVHEWWGLNDHIKRESEKMWNDLGINVIDLDLYDNKVATTREDAAANMQAVTTERAQAIIKGAFDYAGKNAKVFTIGWCFGGGWSLQTALLGGKQTVGAVMFYGQPEKDVERLKTLNSDVIGFFGNLDKWPDPKTVDEFKANMEKAGKKLYLNRYEANHGFANPSNPDFNKEATADAYTKLMAFIKERMKV